MVSRELIHHLRLRGESDVGVARRHTRRLALEHGLPPARADALALAVAEVTRNALVYGLGGELLIEVTRAQGRTGLSVVIRDTGPGIANTEDALTDGYSTGGGLGLGLPAARRLVDRFELRSSPGEGTTVTLEQWSPDR